MDYRRRDGRDFAPSAGQAMADCVECGAAFAPTPEMRTMAELVRGLADRALEVYCPLHRVPGSFARWRVVSPG